MGFQTCGSLLMTCEYASILGLMAPRRGKINPANVIPDTCGRLRLR
jgi:hypothetical protein